MLERCLTIAVLASLPWLLHGHSSVVALPRDTPVRIRPGNSFSIRAAQKHQQIDLKVSEAVSSGNTIAIPKDAQAIGEIVGIHRDGRGRIDRLFIKLLYICTASGQRIPIHLLRSGKADWKIDLVEGAMPRDVETIAYVSRKMRVAPVVAAE